jgi:hypothetical protein
MKKKLFKVITGISFLLLFSIPTVKSQVFWTETFSNSCTSACLASSYTGPNGAWTLTATGTNDAQANEWFISCSENGNAVGDCGSACGSNATLHIGSNDGFNTDISAAYDAGGLCGTLICVATDMRVESPIINCTGHTTITLAFQYMENGDGTNDDASLWYYNGSTWALLDPLAKTPFGSCSPQGKWAAFSISLPASANNNANVKIGLRWVNNDDGIGTDPSVAIDNITLATSGVQISENNFLQAGINIFPNPTEGIFQVQSSRLEVLELEIYNVLGEKVFSKFTSASPSINVDLTDQPIGIYFMKCKTEQGNYIGKVVKQ